MQVRIVRELDERQKVPIGQREIGVVLDGMDGANRAGDVEAGIELESQRDGLGNGYGRDTLDNEEKTKADEETGHQVC